MTLIWWPVGDVWLPSLPCETFGGLDAIDFDEEYFGIPLDCEGSSSDEGRWKDHPEVLVEVLLQTQVVSERAPAYLFRFDSWVKRSPSRCSTQESFSVNINDNKNRQNELTKRMRNENMYIDADRN